MAPSTSSSPPHSSACKKLAPGPASATQTMSRLGWRKRSKRTGTGLAYPNKNAPLVLKYNSRGSKMVPNGSMCGKGLSVTRPSIEAVLSPRRSAA